MARPATGRRLSPCATSITSSASTTTTAIASATRPCGGRGDPAGFADEVRQLEDRDIFPARYGGEIAVALLDFDKDEAEGLAEITRRGKIERYNCHPRPGRADPVLK